MSKSLSIKGRVVGIILYSLLFIYTFIIFFGSAVMLTKDEKDWCMAAKLGYPGMQKIYENPDYNTNPCFKERTIWLLYTNLDECDMARRMLCSVLFGAAIGFERKTSERPAGIRTMSLVCLGACFFTVSSMRAFRSSTMGWDAARVSAAIPSGVGFLGAGLIWKGTTGTKGGPDEKREVHGLTTAAGVWLSSAIGVGVGGRLYVVSAYAVALVIIVLRLGPRLYLSSDNSSFGSDGVDDNDDWDSENNFSGTDEDNDHVDVERFSADEKARLLRLNETREEMDSSIHAYSSVPALGKFDKLSKDNATYEEALNDLQYPRRRPVRLKARDLQTRSLSPRALMRARAARAANKRPTFFS